MGQISLSLSKIAESTVTFPSGKGSQEVSETVSKPVWNPLYLSICLSILFSLSVSLCLCASLSLYIISIYRLLIYRLLFYHNLWDVVQVLPETSITIILGRCCIGSLSDAFPLGLGKNINGIRRSLTTPNLSQTLLLYKIMIRGPTNQNHAQKYHILVGLQMVYK